VSVNRDLGGVVSGRTGYFAVKSQRGFSLIEVVIAIGLLGIVGVALANGLSGSSKALITADERTTAESLARTQMESIVLQPFSTSGNYTVVSMPASYEAVITVAPVMDNGIPRENIQRVMIVVRHGGKNILTSGSTTLEAYKVQ
jgi:prepilin-type N-terminal cleavage/methylation domain-containing protein